MNRRLRTWSHSYNRTSQDTTTALHVAPHLLQTSVDRINSLIGYHNDNIQLVVEWANRAKRSRSNRDFELFIAAIRG